MQDNKNSLLSKDIDELMALYQSSQDERVRSEIYLNIIKNGLNLVKKIVLPISKQTIVSYEDLVQVGAIGLIKAMDSYAPDRNTRISTYATYYIKGELRHYLRDKASFIKAPRKVYELIIKVYNAAKELTTPDNPEPSIEEIAARIKVPPQKVEEVMRYEKYKFIVSLDQTISMDEDNDVSLLDKIPSEDYQEVQDSYETKLTLEKAINQLTPELRQVVNLNFFEDYNQREISTMLGISQMQVSRRLKKALNEMHKIMNRKDI